MSHHDESRDVIDDSKVSFLWGQVGGESPRLAELTTLEVGGRPQFYARITSEDEACEVARWARAHHLPLWVLGEGSNVLCDDHELEGVVIQLALQDISWGEEQLNMRSESPAPQNVEVTLGAGVVWSDFVSEAVKRDLAGVECLIGIPGWVGAAPIQNIGAYGQELSDTCVAVRVYD